MTKNKAARILLNQTKKPLEDNFNFEEWMHQSHALIERFFGKDSEQYNRLHQPIIGNHSNGEIRIQPNRNRQILFICAILKCCSDTVRLNGIYKKRRFFPAHYIVLLTIGILLISTQVYFSLFKGGKAKHTRTTIDSTHLFTPATSKNTVKIAHPGESNASLKN